MVAKLVVGLLYEISEAAGGLEGRPRGSKYQSCGRSNRSKWIWCVLGVNPTPHGESKYLELHISSSITSVLRMLGLGSYVRHSPSGILERIEPIPIPYFAPGSLKAVAWRLPKCR